MFDWNIQMSQSSGSSHHPSSFKELIYNVRDAVVSISGQIGLITDDGTLTTVIKRGTGFFIKGYYIICPASLILISPHDLIDNRRVPNYSDAIPNCSRQHVRVSRILVAVSNVNGSGESLSYEVDIVGIDGAANIAILVINMNHQWNIQNPTIQKCHPFLHWGKSRSMSPGDIVMLIGDLTSSSKKRYEGVENGVVIGNLADNRYVSYDGSVPGELLLLSNLLSSKQQGLPVINEYGKVIGMVLSSPNNNNIAISEFFMRRPVRALIRTFIDREIPEHYRGFIEIVPDPLGNYYRFNKAWLGLSGFLMNQDVFDTDINGNLIVKNNYLLSPDQKKEVVGYVIKSICTEYTSPVFEIISEGDIITHINECPLGDRKGQISPSLVMWRVVPESEVTIKYRKRDENYLLSHEIIIRTASYPPHHDFPWYTEKYNDVDIMNPIII
jgi:S1-C subfamily serine protease